MKTYHVYEVMFIAMNCRYQANELVIIAMKDPFHIWLCTQTCSHELFHDPFI